MLTKKSGNFLFILLMAFLVPTAVIGAAFFQTDGCHADIFKWRDENGNWRFTDSPPSDVDLERMPESQTAAPSDVTDSRTQPPPTSDVAGRRGRAPEAFDNKTSVSTMQDGGVFWRISINGARPSYLLGTIHSADPRVNRLRPSVEQALDASDHFVMEMLMDAGAMLQYSASILMTDGESLESLLDEALYRKVLAAMNDYGFPEMVIRQLKPWAVMAMLSMPKPAGGAVLDMTLYQRAQLNGISASGLERIEEQLSVFEELSMQDQITLLKMTVDQLPSLPAMFEQLIQAYLADDLGRIEQLSDQFKTQNDTRAMKRFMFRLNDQRNDRMVNRILPYLRQGNSFIAVGALHLTGDTGIVAQLERYGYTLTPVR